MKSRFIARMKHSLMKVLILSAGILTGQMVWHNLGPLVSFLVLVLAIAGLVCCNLYLAKEEDEEDD